MGGGGFVRVFFFSVILSSKENSSTKKDQYMDYTRFRYLSHQRTAKARAS